jgi:hypothetical protein
MQLKKAAENLVETLNLMNAFDRNDDWYHGALQLAGATSYFDEAATDEVDPEYASDIFILCDENKKMTVEYNYQIKRWESK